MTPEEREEFAATVARLVAESKVASEVEVVNDSDESDSKEEGSKEE